MNASFPPPRAAALARPFLSAGVALLASVGALRAQTAAAPAKNDSDVVLLSEFQVSTSADKGTVWQYYQLVITQWPSDPTTFTSIENGGVYPAQCGGAFPANGAVNTTMETYFQSPTDATGAGGNSCMSCHYRADQSDFSWGLNRRAH